MVGNEYVNALGLSSRHSRDAGYSVIDSDDQINRVVGMLLDGMLDQGRC